MEKFAVHKFYRYWMAVVFYGLLAATAAAQSPTLTLHPKNGTAVTGTILDMGDQGIRLQLSDGTYMDNPIPWGLLSQDDLKVLQNNPKAEPYVEPFIQIPRSEKLERTQVDIKDPPRLTRPASGSVFAALVGSSVGLVMLLLVYLGNLYAAYEISLFRAQPPALVCGISAVAPVLGPIIFLALPTRLRGDDYEAQAGTDENLDAAIAAEQAVPMPAAPAKGGRRAATQPVATTAATAAAAGGKTFVRGQFTFNRRFFETQMPGFFGVVRPLADQNTVLTFKTARGTYVVNRISRISPNDIHIQVVKGNASEEITIPFLEIQEVYMTPAEG
ncbi:MAG TPA: hypothetical protein VN048_12355 [Verrucomicrobiae bacterium]|nr:hypothetical protein [Verrucomicrobiae bacterium]